MNTKDFETTIAHINGYLEGLGQLCYGKNYVPLYQAIACSQLTQDITLDIHIEISSKLSEHNECNSFQLINNWEAILRDSIDKWIFKRLFGGNSDIQSNDYVSLSKRNTICKLIRLIHEAIAPDDLQVWKFQISHGYCYQYGFDNEAYAFKSNKKLFIMTFGWVD
jgi:hypothetical protein